MALDFEVPKGQKLLMGCFCVILSNTGLVQDWFLITGKSSRTGSGMADQGLRSIYTFFGFDFGQNYSSKASS